MAEVTAFRNNALPYPVYGVPFTLVFPIFDADGDLVSGATGLDSERSLNGDTPADCTNEATEIGSSGKYYLTLTAAENTADIVDGVTKTSSSGAKTTPWTLYPKKLVALRTGTAQGGAAGYITLDASAGSLNDVWNGCLVVANIDGNIEARIITDYNGSNQQASVTPNWNVNPDSDDTFTIYLPDGLQIPAGSVPQTGDSYSRLGAPAGASVSADVAAVKGETASILARIGSFAGSGVNNILGFLRALGRKDVAAPSDFGGNYDPATDSTEALRDRGDAAWITATGFATPTDVSNSQTAIINAINALNQSASRRVVLQVLSPFERPESGNSTFEIEVRTYDGDGAATNADSAPSLTATGGTSGSLAANLSASSNPATGVYRWTYTVASNATIEPIRFEVSATLSAATFTMTAFSQVADFVAATFTTTDRADLQAAKASAAAIEAKLPSKTHLTGTNNADGDIQANEMTGNYPGSVGSVAGNVVGSLGSLAAQAKADVNAEVDTALGDYDGPTNTEMIARTLPSAEYATAANLLTLDGKVVTIDSIVDAIKVSTDRFETMIQLDGSVYRFTINALEQAPSGGGGGGDPWATDLEAGAYTGNQAGAILFNNLDAQVSELLGGATPTPRFTEDCGEVQTFDAGEKKPVYVSLTADGGTFTITSAKVFLQTAEGVAVGTLTNIDATGYDAGGLVTARAWFNLNTAAPNGADAALAVGTYSLLFVINGTGSDGIARTHEIPVVIVVV